MAAEDRNVVVQQRGLLHQRPLHVTFGTVLEQDSQAVEILPLGGVEQRLLQVEEILPLRDGRGAAEEALDGFCCSVGILLGVSVGTDFAAASGSPLVYLWERMIMLERPAKPRGVRGAMTKKTSADLVTNTKNTLPPVYLTDLYKIYSISVDHVGILCVYAQDMPLHIVQPEFHAHPSDHRIKEVRD